MMKSTIKITLTEIQQHWVALIVRPILTALVAKLKRHAHPTLSPQPAAMLWMIVSALLGIQETQARAHSASQININIHQEARHALHAP